MYSIVRAWPFCLKDWQEKEDNLEDVIGRCFLALFGRKELEDCSIKVREMLGLLKVNFYFIYR